MPRLVVLLLFLLCLNSVAAKRDGAAAKRPDDSPRPRAVGPAWRTGIDRPKDALLLFVKIPKCASSTSGGVVRRIAAMEGLKGATTDLLDERLAARYGLEDAWSFAARCVEACANVLPKFRRHSGRRRDSRTISPTDDPRRRRGNAAIRLRRTIRVAAAAMPRFVSDGRSAAAPPSVSTDDTCRRRGAAAIFVFPDDPRCRRDPRGSPAGSATPSATPPSSPVP